MNFACRRIYLATRVLLLSLTDSWNPENLNENRRIRFWKREYAYTFAWAGLKFCIDVFFKSLKGTFTNPQIYLSRLPIFISTYTSFRNYRSLNTISGCEIETLKISESKS